MTTFGLAAPIRAPQISGSVSVSGDVALSGDPAWATSIAVGEWGVVTSTSLSVSGAGWSGTTPGAGTFAAVINAWGGAVVAADGFYSGSTLIEGPGLILWGGGHSDYGGNEVYALSLKTNTPTWYRLRDPTFPVPTNVAEDGSGNPVSRHTYDCITYISDGARQWMLAYGVNGYYNIGSGALATHVWDFTQASPNSTSPWSRKANPTYANKTVAYESTSGRVWSCPDSVNAVEYYDVAANTYSSALFKANALGSNPCSDIDTVRGLWFMWSGAGLQGYRTNSGTGNDYYAPTTTGTAPSTFGGFLYDPDADAFKYWGGGKTIYTLTPPGTSPYQGGNAWTWSSTTPAGGSTPTSANINGTYGRFSRVVIGTIKGYIAVNATNESVYFYRTA